MRKHGAFWLVPLVALLLALAPHAALSLPAEPTPLTPDPTPTLRPTLPPRAYLPLVYSLGPGPTIPGVSFWADRVAINAGECVTLRWRVVGAQFVTLDDMTVPSDASRQVCPATHHTYRLAAYYPSGVAGWVITIMVVTLPATLFYADQYTLPSGGCTALRWNVPNAEAIYLDGAGVTSIGSQQVCPLATQFYTLEVLDRTGSDRIYQVVLTAGEPALSPHEIIAAAIVDNITQAGDINPAEPGNQPGYQVALKPVRILWTGGAHADYTAVMLGVPQVAIDPGDNGPLHWPLHPGQHVEFRAACQDALCLLDYTTEHYLYATSE